MEKLVVLEVIMQIRAESGLTDSALIKFFIKAPAICFVGSFNILLVK